MAEQVAAHLNFSRFSRASRTVGRPKLDSQLLIERTRKPGFEHSQFRRAQIQVLQSRDMDAPDSYIFPLCKHGQSSGSIQSSPSRTSPGGHLQPDQLGPVQTWSIGPSSARKWSVEHVGSQDVTSLEWIWFEGQTKSFPHPESLQLQLADTHSLKTIRSKLIFVRVRRARTKADDGWFCMVVLSGTTNYWWRDKWWMKWFDECTESWCQILSMKYSYFEYSKEEDRNYKLDSNFWFFKKIFKNFFSYFFCEIFSL